MQIELRNIHKYYGPIKANNGINLKIEAGEIHGILGENGAGKSTLMKILAGFSQRTKGLILVDGTEVDYQNPAQSAALGIGMLYQDPLDFPLLSVLDNFMLGQTDGLGSERKKFRQSFNALVEALNFPLAPGAALKTLTIGERQQLEIIRLMACGIQVLILDEPTTGISSTQKEVLFDALKKLAVEGKSIILVSHKLEDVETLCDRVTVLRQGAVSGEMDWPFDSRKLLEMMFGTPPVFPPRCSEAAGREVLVMQNVFGSGGRAGLKDCHAAIRESEVVGLAGLEGSGQGIFLRIGRTHPRRQRSAPINFASKASRVQQSKRFRAATSSDCCCLFCPTDRSCCCSKIRPAVWTSNQSTGSGSTSTLIAVKRPASFFRRRNWTKF